MGPRIAIALLLLAGCACQRGGSGDLGAPCATAAECGGALVCRFGACRAACETSADCAGGASCLVADGRTVCGLATEIGCTGGAHPCPMGLACVADRCEAPCASSVDCPPDRVCEPISAGLSACVAASTDAGVRDAEVDASIDDAGNDAAFTMHGVIDACIGTTVACAIAANGDVYCWGASSFGALVDGASSCTAIERGPTRVDRVANADVIACGDDFVCAHQNSGEIRCWGANDVGQLGRGVASACETSPYVVVDEAGTMLSVELADLTAAGDHACALSLLSGALTCWGRNAGVIDVRASADPSATFPRAVDALQPMRDAPTMPLASGAMITIARISATGAIARITGRDVYVWGDNTFLETRSTPGIVSTALISTGAGRGVDGIAGRAHRCAIDAGGVVCWGANGLGQLGHASSASSPTCGTEPCEPPGAATGSFSAIATSGDGDTTCGIEAGGASVRCWGDNAHGLAGVDPSTTPIATIDGATVSFPTATRMPITRVVVGRSAACAIDAAHALFCWGDHDLSSATPDVITPALVAIDPP